MLLCYLLLHYCSRQRSTLPLLRCIAITSVTGRTRREKENFANSATTKKSRRPFIRRGPVQKPHFLAGGLQRRNIHFVLFFGCTIAQTWRGFRKMVVLASSWVQLKISNTVNKTICRTVYFSNNNIFFQTGEFRTYENV